MLGARLHADQTLVRIVHHDATCNAVIMPKLRSALKSKKVNTESYE